MPPKKNAAQKKKAKRSTAKKKPVSASSKKPTRTKKKTTFYPKKNLSNKAEQRLKTKKKPAKELSQTDFKKLIHELEVHQIELEMQNEELKQTQAELESSRNRYRDLYDFAPVGYFTLDRNGLILETNLTAAGMLGMARQHLIKKRFHYFITPGFRDAFHLYREQVLASTEPQWCAFQCKRKDGSLFDIELQGVAQPDREGNPSTIMAAALDITQRKLLEDILHRWERELKSLTDNIPDIVGRVDQQLRHVFINPAIKPITGKRVEDYLGKTNEELGYSTEYCKLWTNFFRRVFRTKEPAEVEFEFDSPQQGRLVFSMRAVPEFEPDGTVQTVAFVSRDVTAMKRMEQQLERYNKHLEEVVRTRTQSLHDKYDQLEKVTTLRKITQEELDQQHLLLETIFASLTHPLFLMDEDCRLIIANQPALDYYQSTDESIPGRPCYEAFRKKRTVCKNCKIIPALKDRQPVRFEQQSIVNPQQIESVSIYPFQISDGEYLFTITIRDLTKEKVLEQRLTLHNKLSILGMMIAGISHEIHNPNNVISLNIPVLREYFQQIMPVLNDHAKIDRAFKIGNMTVEEFREDVDKLLSNMEHSTERITSTVNNLRNYMMVKPKGLLPHVDLASVVKKALTLCEHEIKKKVKTFEVSVKEDHFPIRTDPAILEHVIVNLLMNAVQSMDKEDSFIKLEIFQKDQCQDQTIIQVSDNGRGISKKAMEQMYTPFFSEGDKEQPGMGLGLFMCKNMVEGLGGRIQIKSRVRRGTTIRVILPEVENITAIS